MLALVATVVEPNVADIESSAAVARLATSYAEHMSLPARLGGVCRMAPGTRDSLLMLMSSCLGCSGGSPVCPSDGEFGKSGLESGSYSKLPHLDCSAPEHSMRNELEDWVPGGSSGLGDHVLGWYHCTELRPRDCVDDHKFVALDIRRFDFGQSQQTSVLDACDVHLALNALRLGGFVAIAFGRSAVVWMETLHCLIRRSHHRLTLKNERLVGGIVVDA